MVKTRSRDSLLYTTMPVKDSLIDEDNLGGSISNDSIKDHSYNPSGGRNWDRELRNRYVFGRSRRTEERVSSSRKLLRRSCRRIPHRTLLEDVDSDTPPPRSTRSRRSAPEIQRKNVVDEDEEAGADAEDEPEEEVEGIFTPISPRRRRTLFWKHRHSAPISKSENSERLVDKDSPVDGEGEGDGEGVRRSKRQRKLLYDNFNTSWILGTQTLRGYPMLMPIKQQDPIQVKPDDDEDIGPQKINISTSVEPAKEMPPNDAGDDLSPKISASEDEKEPEKKERQAKPPIEDGFVDMYSRVKRPRPFSRSNGNDRQPLCSDENSSDSCSHRIKYSLRKNKPIVDRFQASHSSSFNRVHYSMRRRCRGRANGAVVSRRDSDSTDTDSSFEQRPTRGAHQRTNNELPHPHEKTKIHHGPSASTRKNDANTIEPTVIDHSVTFQHVGGLDQHIRSLKEVVVFPMLYPEVFDRFHIKPPKGVLFHGPPGTGKTLLARALANESSIGDRRVSFFTRKGADCLSKWVGESERQLRLLFEQAYEKRPSIIFFDELDGLAPVRTSRQDQIHASIVSTLLALIDGLDDRGEVIVIGATNRVDAIDPALRRPGRFDRELYFPLPGRKEREEILRIHVAQWSSPPPKPLLAQLAEQAAGYCGSDLRALCSEAVLHGLRRRYPQIYKSRQKLLLDAASVQVEPQDFARAQSSLIPSSHRSQPSPSRVLSPLVAPLLKKQLEDAMDRLKEIFPASIPGHIDCSALEGNRCQPRPHLLMCGNHHDMGQTTYLAPALLQRLEHIPVHQLDLATLYQHSGVGPEEACLQVFQEARRTTPSIIYIPGMDEWWKHVPPTVAAVFHSQTARLDPTRPVLILATSDDTYCSLPQQLVGMFTEYRDEVLIMVNPNNEERRHFFQPLFTEDAFRTPEEYAAVQSSSQEPESFPPLPLAPPSPVRKLTAEELRKIYESEEVTLRELRIFLRDICAKLAKNKQFYMFTKPVDIEEVPDYLTIIKQPMDLETMMNKIDLQHYVCAQDFLEDIDLLCRNALEYNPDRDPADKLIRHRACSLRDTAYTLIDAEMDSDFEEHCRKIAKSRRTRQEVFEPSFLKHLPPVEDVEPPVNKPTTSNHHPPILDVLTQVARKESIESLPPPKLEAKNGESNNLSKLWTFSTNSERKKFSKRRTPAWARGEVKKRKINNKFRVIYSDANSNGIADDSDLEIKKLKKSDGKSSPPELPLVNGELSADELDKPELNGLEKSNETSDSNKNVINGDKRGSDNQSISPKATPNNRELSAKVSDNQSISPKLTPNKRELSEREILLSRPRMEGLLSKIIRRTRNCSVETLIGVYAQLDKCVRKYREKWDRSKLEQDLTEEIDKFKEVNKTQIQRNDLRASEESTLNS